MDITLIEDNNIREQVEYAIAEQINLKIFSHNGIVNIINGNLIDYLPSIYDDIKGIIYVIRIKQNDNEENYFRISSLGITIDYANRIKNIDPSAEVDILQVNTIFNNKLNCWMIADFKFHSSIIL